MLSLRPMDPAFPIERQLGVDASPVVLVNVFTLDPADEAAMLATWKKDAEYMKAQPGFISTQLHPQLETVRCTSTTRCGSPTQPFGPRSRIPPFSRSSPPTRIPWQRRHICFGKSRSQEFA